MAVARIFTCSLSMSSRLEANQISVSENRSDYEAGKIFVDSPLARGLLRKKVGDKVAIKVPAGTLNLEILSIRFVEK